MCGIAGVVGRRPGDDRLVGAMCARLAHRGPDDRGVVVDDDAVLGLSRLAIIDVAGGHQPLGGCEDGAVWVTCNGEIYNYVELRSELVARGHRFRTGSDTEVVAHLYEEEGIDLLARLNGMFALAIWDGAARTLHLARDRLGIKPLYHTAGGGRLAWASELKALLEDPSLRRDLDLDAVAEYLTLLYVPHPRTPFAAVRKLAPGTYLRWREGTVTEHRWWRYPVPDAAPDAGAGAHGEAIRAHLRDAVRLQLRADVPVGLFASGGVDSTALMWAASSEDVALEAFLVEFDDLAADTPYARLAAQATGIPLTELRLDSGRAAALLPRLVWQLDEPLADPAIIPSWLVAEQAATRVRVILSGTGGDELFGGYGRYTFPPPDHRAAYTRHLNVHPEHEVRAALGLDAELAVAARLDELYAAAGGADAPGTLMYADANLYLPGDLFMVLDKTSMAASLEARVPLLDHHLVGHVAGLAGETRMPDGDLKRLFRSALRGHVPEAILDRPKQGFSPPILRWWQGSLGRSADRLLWRADGRVRELVGDGALDRWLGPGAVPDDLRALRAWSLVVLELWWRAYVDGADLGAASLDDVAA